MYRHLPAAGQAAFLDKGRLLLAVSPQGVLKRPRNPRIDRFVDTYFDRGTAMLA